MMAIPKSGVKPAKAAPLKIANMYELVANMDGNANTVKEFDEMPHDDDEVFFNAAKDATDDDKTRCLILNYIHKDLQVNIDRIVPYNSKEDKKVLEVYHRAEYNGVKLDVCVFWPGGERDSKGRKAVVAMVKLASADMTEDSLRRSAVTIDASHSADTKADKFSKKAHTLNKNYWAPRWKYVVAYLRQRMEEDFNKNGMEIYRDPEPESADEAEGGENSTEVVEEVFQVFAGCTGGIIGPGGSKIKEIKASSGIVNIELPEKKPDGPRGKTLVDVTLKGTKSSIQKAKKILEEFMAEWRSQGPRGPRDSGSGDGGNGGGWGSNDNAGGGGAPWGEDGGAVVGAVEPEGNWGAAAGGDGAASGDGGGW